jgi:DNA polymerase-3 subunit delta'
VLIRLVDPLLVIQPVADDKRKTSADTIFIEQVREVVDFMHQTPSESAWRVVIIDPAEAMNTAAANALLKVLEEPPAQALLILVTHQAGKLLPTIRSRCRKITLRTPDEAACAKIFEQQEQSIPAESLHQLLALAQGSAGKALHYHAQNALVVYQDILEVLANPNPKAATGLATQAAKSGVDQWQVTQALFMQAMYRISLFAAAPAKFSALNAEEEQAFAAMLSHQSLPHWLDLWEKAGVMLPQTNSLTMDKNQTMLSLLRA